MFSNDDYFDGNKPHNNGENLPETPNSAMLKRLTPDELKTLTSLTASYFTPLNLCQGGEMDALAKILSIDRYLLTDEVSIANAQIAKWRTGESNFSYDKLYEIVRHFTGGFHKIVSLISDKIEEKREELKEATFKGWQNCNENEDEQELLSAYILNAEFQLELLKFCFDYFVPGEEGYYHTNLKAFSLAVNQIPKEIEKVLNDLEKEYKKGENGSEDLIEQLKEKFLVPEEQLKLYTSISPFLLRATICSLDLLRISFLNELTTGACKKEDFIKALTEDFDYDESQLTYAVSKPSYSLVNSEQDIIITWEVPALLSNSAVKNQDILGEKIAPLKKLLKKFSTELNLEVNRHEIVMTISCPSQHQPEEPLCKSLSDTEFYSRLRSSILIQPKVFTPTFLISNRNDESFELTFDGDLLRLHEGREQIVSVLSSTDHFKKPFSAVNLEDIEKVDITFEDDTNIIIPSSSFLENEELEKISQIANLECFKYLSVSYDDPSNLIDNFSKITQLINRADRTNSGELHIRINESLLNIYNQDHEIICHARYMPELKEFAGRFCSSALIHEVINAYKSIYDEQKTNNQNTDQNDFVSNRFCNELRRRGIYPTDDFIRLHKRAVSLYMGDIASGLEEVCSHIFGEKVTIKKEPDGRIILDCHYPDSSDQVEEFYKRNIIE